MSDYTITVKEIVSWFETKVPPAGIILAGIHEGRGTTKPSAFADYDTDWAIGRIVIWVSGEAEFQILRRSDGTDVMVHHEHVPLLAALDNSYGNFLSTMTNPDRENLN